MASPNYLKTKATRKSAAVKSLQALSRAFYGECRSGRKFAPALGKSQPTAQDRLDHPSNFTLDELITASINLGFSGCVSLQNGETTVVIKW